MEEGVDERGKRLRSRKQRSTFSEKGQHGCAQIPVEGQGHVCGTESNLTQKQRQEKRGKMEKIIYILVCDQVLCTTYAL